MLTAPEDATNAATALGLLHPSYIATLFLFRFWLQVAFTWGAVDSQWLLGDKLGHHFYLTQVIGPERMQLFKNKAATHYRIMYIDLVLLNGLILQKVISFIYISFSVHACAYVADGSMFSSVPTECHDSMIVDF